MQAKLHASALQAQGLQDEVTALQGQVSAYASEKSDLQKQLEGLQLAARAAARQNEEVAANLMTSEAKVAQLRQEAVELQEQIRDTNATKTAAEERAREAESRARLADQHRAVAERAVQEWQQVAEERRRMAAEHEQRLQKVSEASCEHSVLGLHMWCSMHCLYLSCLTGCTANIP
jgi:chromosome segregation ATPase